MLVLSEQEVAHLLPVREAIGVVREAFIAYSAGTILCPQRLPLPLMPEGAVLLSMPAFDGRRFAGVKLVSVQPLNAAQQLPVVRATYHLFAADCGDTLAVIGASGMTAVRTGAAGGLAADLLALADVDTLAVIGAGAQAVTQTLAAVAVRPIRNIWLYSRTRSRTEAFAQAVAAQVDARVHLADSADDAVRHARLVVTATSATTPVFADDAVQPGTHITAVGAFTAAMQEVPDATVARAGVYVDAMDSAWHESGELAGPCARGLIARDHCRGELGSLAAGTVAGRQSDSEITLFKSVGLAAQDLACAVEVYRRALEQGIGLHAALE